ncbi:hypothetical protein [Geminicoccus roseus]|nr:hypothetical protein [Geminicoccus roseus]
MKTVREARMGRFLLRLLAKGSTFIGLITEGDVKLAQVKGGEAKDV